MQFQTKLLVAAFISLLMAYPVFAKNIAVMPFENITKDADKNWIGAGFAETLTTKLCKVKEVNLLEREQLSKILDEIKFQKSGLVDESTAVQTGKMYGVDVMVFGSYQVMGDTLRVSARFVDVETRKVIDTAETTGDMADIFKLQDNIAFSLMDSLKVVLGEKEKQEVTVNPTEDLTAYQWYSKGNDAFNLKLYNEAIECYQEAINLDPKHADAYDNMGFAYYRKGNYDSAIEMCEKAISINPEYANAYDNMGVIYAHKGDFDKAIEMYEKAISINPEFAEAYDNMGSAYAKKGNYDKAIYVNIGKDKSIAYTKKGNYDKAIELFEKAISINPEYADAYFNMGLAYDYKGNYDKAIEMYEKAVSINTKYAAAYNNMGSAYDDKGNHDKAIEMYEKAISIKPEYADAYFNMGVSYGQQGNYDKAISCLKKAAILGSKEAQKYLTAKRINW